MTHCISPLRGGGRVATGLWRLFSPSACSIPGNHATQMNTGLKCQKPSSFPGFPITCLPLLGGAKSAEQLSRRCLSRTAFPGVSADTFSRLYREHHVPVPPFERAKLAFHAAIGAVTAPHRGHHLAALGELTAGPSLSCMRDAMRADVVGRRILQNRPLIDEPFLNLAALRRLPAGTLGRAYVHFLDAYKFRPDEREPVHFVDDEELAYIMTRYRQLHDFLHVLYGLGVAIECELALKVVELQQTKLPMTFLASVFGAAAVPLVRITNFVSAIDNTQPHACASSFTASEPERTRTAHIPGTRYLGTTENWTVVSPVHVENRQCLSGAEAAGKFREVVYPKRVFFNDLLPWVTPE
eukprot:GHVT01047625.1.p1 GENE.GHVT01047625.1~~GHVT01047625.1.p1  ORF type:complete len:354 (-),score=26.44 GHVT01047625.1:1666-2727(-)